MYINRELKRRSELVREEHVSESIATSGSKPLFSEVKWSATDIGDDINPMSQCHLVTSIMEEQEHGLSAYLNYERRDVEYHQRISL